MALVRGGEGKALDTSRPEYPQKIQREFYWRNSSTFGVGARIPRSFVLTPPFGGLGGSTCVRALRA